MKPSRVIDTDVTPNGEPIELVFERGHYVVRIEGEALMSSAMHGSEEAMAKLAARRLRDRSPSRVLVGGLGMGFTLRAALESFEPRVQITVAELIPAVVRFNHGELGDLADHPLQDRRVTLFQGDVSTAMSHGNWDAVLMDVDNGPDAFTVWSNEDLYTADGIQKATDALSPGGVFVLWSAAPSPEFVRVGASIGVSIEPHRVRARAKGKGPRHTLFVIQAAE